MKLFMELLKATPSPKRLYIAAVLRHQTALKIQRDALYGGTSGGSVSSAAVARLGAQAHLA